MRKTLLSLSLMFAVTLSASAQAAQPKASGWERVQALAPGSTVYVQAKGHSDKCKVTSSDSDSLKCVGSDPTKVIAYQKSEIKKISMSHRGRSALIGLAVGAGVGAGVGYGVGKSQNTNGSLNFNGLLTGAATAIFAVGLGIIGAIVGALTDFTGKTIYKS